MVKPILIFIVAFLSAIIFVLTIILILVIKQIDRITKLKARQYSAYQDYLEKGKTVFLGDSLTEFFRIEEFFHQFNPYNRGIASDKTIGVLERLESNVIALKPSKVFLQIGTNDLNSKKQLRQNLLVNIKEILLRLKENLPNAQIYFISLYPVNRKAKFFSIFFVGKRKNNDIAAINSEVEAFCNDNNFVYIDIYNNLLDENGNLNKKYTIEGLHLNFEGYCLIASLLFPYLEA
ncbi:MAG TPA: lysophospholipase [Acholeplasmataceae bacterium]|jgi:lysophospholipase L1-like esterase|nr:lysophospholipase [Acholeplasmataceae bacterium]